MPRFDVKDYIDVQERINRFWSEYPDGALITRMISGESDFEAVVIHASAYKHRDDKRPSATGIASEKPGRNANETSWHENGETSAIGRALANMGYATSIKDRPSKQEMEKVERHAPPPRSVPAAGGTPPPPPGPVTTNAAPPPPAPPKAPAAAAPAPPPPGRPAPPTPIGTISEKQLNFICGLAKEVGFVSDDGHHNEEALNQYCVSLFQTPFRQLSREQASELIEELQSQSAERSKEPTDPDIRLA